MERIIKNNQKEIKTQIICLTISVIVWILFAAILSEKTSELTAFSGLFFFIIINLYMRIRKLISENKKSKEWITDFQDEIDHLLAQVPKNTPSDEEISKWLDADIKKEEEKAILDLHINIDELLKSNKAMNPRDLHGFSIEDWGAIQSSDTVGKKNLDFLHLWAMQVGEDAMPRFAVYYIQFIFPMDDQIAVCGFFYDFILEERKGLMTAEYFYRHVVSVTSATVEETTPLNPAKQIETTVFQLTVSSGDSIRVALTDEKTVDNINDQIKAKYKFEKDQQRKIGKEEIKDDDDVKTIACNKEDLPATRGREIMAFITEKLRYKEREIIEKIKGEDNGKKKDIEKEKRLDMFELSRGSLN